MFGLIHTVVQELRAEAKDIGGEIGVEVAEWLGVGETGKRLWRVTGKVVAVAAVSPVLGLLDPWDEIRETLDLGAEAASDMRWAALWPPRWIYHPRFSHS